MMKHTRQYTKRPYRPNLSALAAYLQPLKVNTESTQPKTGEPIMRNPVTKRMTTPKTFPPAFTQAMRQYERIAALHGEESEQARDAFTTAMFKAPKWFQDEANAKAQEMGLIPEHPSGYSNDGEAFYTLEDLAKSLGITYEEAEQHMHKLTKQRTAAGLSNDGILINDGSNFNRRQ